MSSAIISDCKENYLTAYLSITQYNSYDQYIDYIDIIEMGDEKIMGKPQYDTIFNLIHLQT
jgi:hypothetical protein